MDRTAQGTTITSLPRGRARRRVGARAALGALAALAVAALATATPAGCASEFGARECGNGLFCPEGTECSADLTTCIKTGGCGNALVGPDEQCDDGNLENNDECLSTCRLNTCGDGFVSPGVEECDDGNQNQFDDCLNTCKRNACRDGFQDMQPPLTEVCDDGDNDNTNGCYNDCSGGAGCGNGEIDRDMNGVPIEECDDGNMSNTDLCVTSTMAYQCRRSRCGDGFIASDAPPPFQEECDGAAPMSTGGPVETATCDIDCTDQECGDGRVNGTAGEQCDDGNRISGDGCDDNCKPTSCPNGVRTAGEQCDDGNGNDADTCTNECRDAVCGDGITRTSPAPAEGCDDGNTTTEQCAYGQMSCTVCSAACQTVAGETDFCGDTVIDAPQETCDDGNAVTEECPYGMTCNVCSNTCRIIPGETDLCGDGTTDAPNETCDDSNQVTEECPYGTSCTVCNAACQQVAGDTDVCGDSTVDAPTENCDDGNAMTEECPYGSTSCLVCNASCRVAAGDTDVCGDFNTDSPNEQCDDGNTALEECAYGQTSCTVCNATCQSQAGETDFCNDGTRDAPQEACDDSNASCGTCSATCQVLASGRATGTLVNVRSGALIAGETFALSDGFNPPTRFEVTTDPAQPDGTVLMNGNIAFSIEVPANAGQLGARLRTLINSVGTTLLITATGSGAVTTLTHDRATVRGNVAALAETVADPDFTVSAMAGGAGGDCAAMQACRSNEDCESGLCTGNTCQ